MVPKKKVQRSRGKREIGIFCVSEAKIRCEGRSRQRTGKVRGGKRVWEGKGMKNGEDWGTAVFWGIEATIIKMTLIRAPEGGG